MTNKDLIKAGCLLGGILGLGFITYLVLKEEDDENEQDERYHIADPWNTFANQPLNKNSFNSEGR